MTAAGAVAAEYHERTKHSFESVRRGGRGLDWSNRPSPFKEYRGLEPLPLPRELERLLRLGAGVIRTREYGGDAYHFRTYSSAGGLYPNEIYVACAELEATPAGLYHFHPRELALRRLRDFDVRVALVSAPADVVLVVTGIMWRSAWKYDARAYRHLYWDAGTMLANLLELAAWDQLAPRVVTGFIDDWVNAIVGIDGRREAALALLALGRAPLVGAEGFVRPLEVDVAPVSSHERTYAEAEELHRASELARASDVRAYTGAWEPPSAAPTRVASSREELERAIRLRVSVRDFSDRPIPRDDFTGLLAAAAAPIPLDVPPYGELYVIANAVDGLEPGAYRFSPPGGFELLRRGEFRAEARFLVLEQPLGALAAAVVFVLADLDRVFRERGDRGYRAVHLDAGIRTGRIYLGAFARGLAATASTFYDDDVSRFLAPELSPILCAAVGYARR